MSSSQPGECKAPSRQAVEEWLERIDDITASVQEILNEDPMEAARRRQEREAQRRQLEMDERLEKVKMRYDPRYYARFENDEVIDRLLKEAELGTAASRRKTTGDESLLTRAERVSLGEAIRLKDEAAKAVRASEWNTACELYATAINLNLVDMELHRTLRNNRALVLLKLERYLDAVDDTSYVLAEDPTNVKALLRRATALRHLHRPLDALKDAEEALKKEPTSPEARDLALWLRRAKSEHNICAAFQHRQSQEEKKLSTAVMALRECIPLLIEKDISNHHNKGRDGEKLLLQVVESVGQCLAVVQSFHKGAAVLFVLLHGLRPLIELLCMLVSLDWMRLVDSVGPGSAEQISTRGMAFVVSTRLLALVLLGSETGVEGLKPQTVVTLVKGLADVLSNGMQQKLSGDRESNGATLTLTVATLQALEGLAVRFPVQVHSQCGSILLTASGFVTKRLQTPQLLFFYCGLLEALLGEPTLSATVVKDMKETLPHAIEMAITAEPQQLKEVGLSLAVRATCVCSAYAKSMGSPKSTHILANLLLPSLKETHHPPLSPRAEEGFYAVVYNILLQVESRPQYVKQWSAETNVRNNEHTSFAMYTWRMLCEWVCDNRKSTERVTVYAKMMAVLAKFSPHDKLLREAMLENEETLWGILSLAHPGDEPANAACLTTLEGEEEMRPAAAAAWELIEHTTTCIASYYSQNLLSKEKGLIVAARVDILLRIIQSAGVQRTVALGNAALIASFVPPIGCDNFTALHGVDILLGSLRSVREFLFQLEHDGKRGSTQWLQTGTAQKNLAIALSRCCTVESQRDRLRELKGFETLHAVLETQ